MSPARLLLLAIVAILAGSVLPAQDAPESDAQESDAPLRLEDIFELPGQPEASGAEAGEDDSSSEQTEEVVEPQGWRTRDAGDAPFEYLPIRVFQRTPDAAEPGGLRDEDLTASLPEVEPRRPTRQGLERDLPAFLFSDRGPRRDLPQGFATLQFRNLTRGLAVRFVLTPLDGDGEPAGEPLVFQMRPGAEESFLCPPGWWRARREVWVLGEPEPVVIDRWEVQNLLPANAYDHELGERDERDLSRLLGAPRRWSR